MAAAGEDDFAAFLEQLALASDLDLAFQLQIEEAIQASLRPNSPTASSSSSSRAAAAPIAEDRWAHDGDYLERPLDPTLARSQQFRILFKGMTSKEVLGPNRQQPQGVAVLAVAVCGPQGEVVLRMRKLVEGFVGGRKTIEVMALLEGLRAALRLGIRNATIVTDYILLHNHMLGFWRPKNKLSAMINQVWSLQMKFEQCEISLVDHNQVSFVVKLARDYIDAQIAKALAVSTWKEKEKTETCTICLEDTGVSKIHAVEGCAHRFCFSCMKDHVKSKLLNGMLPGCPQEGCTTKLSVEGSKMFLSSRLLEIMVERIREGQIPPTQKIYCPYPKCSALMSLSELIHPMQESSSKYTPVDAATLRKCVKCRGSFCMRCKVPWHDRMTCFDYKRMFPHARQEDAKLQNLAQQRLWRQCVRCEHMIEFAEGCYHMTCVCGYEFCYTCGKEWKEKKATCTCPLWEERNIIRNDGDEDDDMDEEEEEDYYDDDVYYGGRQGPPFNNLVYAPLNGWVVR